MLLLHPFFAVGFGVSGLATQKVTKTPQAITFSVDKTHFDSLQTINVGFLVPFLAHGNQVGLMLGYEHHSDWTEDVTETFPYGLVGQFSGQIRLQAIHAIVLDRFYRHRFYGELGVGVQYQFIETSATRQLYVPATGQTIPLSSVRQYHHAAAPIVLLGGGYRIDQHLMFGLDYEHVFGQKITSTWHGQPVRMSGAYISVQFVF